MPSVQTLVLTDRRAVAGWAADCAEHVLSIFERQAPEDSRPRALIARTRAFADAEAEPAETIRRRFKGGVPADAPISPAAAAAARSAGQAVATAHMGAHALGAAAYAVGAAGLAAEDEELETARAAEIGWQRAQMSDPVVAALRSLPPVGQDRTGPLGPGLLSSGAVGACLAQIQRALHRDG